MQNPTRTTFLLYLALGLFFCPSPAKSNEVLGSALLADDHWSFQPPQRPGLPKIRNRNWPRNPIDYFVLAKLETNNVKPLAPAKKRVLMRRAYYDLIGLPPNPNELSRFLNDHRQDAYERMIDRLLATHQYGQKWSQHWLDLARFAETDGFEHDKIRSNAWRYRDWVIDALNEDMPYDEFIRFQLAGDELDQDAKQTVATMFCLSGPDMPDINSQEERRQIVLNELTGTIGATLLGLQMACAQCHDHKFDPLSQKDFFQMRSIFEPALTVKKNQSLSVLSENSSTANKSFLMIRGDWQRRGSEVHPNVPEILAAKKTFDIIPRDKSTGRRSAFADWMVSPKNPLTARVIVNRIWQFHFGTGIVESSNDFGLMGETPTHPDLLDWLALELIENNWSIKHLHRLILTSSTYRQKASSEDSDESLLVGFPRQRLAGEIIRDAMLHASQSLNFHVGGKGVMPPIPDEMKKTLLKNQWITSKNKADHYRRSIYIFARRNLRYPIFEAFDRPDGNSSCARRNQSTTAPQSLHLLNSEFSLDASRRLAGYLVKHYADLDLLLKDAFARVLNREPKKKELQTLNKFLQSQVAEIEVRQKENPHMDLPTPIPAGKRFDQATQTAISLVCLALFNTNEFLYID